MKKSSSFAYISKMALRNLSRYRKRTLITAGAIAYGLMMLIVVRALLIGVDTDSERNLKLYETATGRVMALDYWENRELLPLEKSFIPDEAEKILQDVGAQTTPRVRFSGSLIFYKDPFLEDGDIPGILTAIDPLRDEDVFSLKDSLVEGQWLQDGENGVLLGERLARDIGAQVGYPLIVETWTKDGYTQIIDLEVVGILNCPNPEITRGGIFIPLSLADDYLEMDGTITELNVSFGMGKNADKRFAKASLSLQDENLEALGWKILGADFIAVSETKKGSSGAIILLVLIIAGVGITNTMQMAVYERVRELGMLRALGMFDRQIRSLFILESTGIGMLGGIMGVVMGVVINIPLTIWGIDYSAYMQDTSFGYRVQSHIYSAWDVPGIIGAFFIGTGIAVLVAAFSTGRILRMNIPDSLRFQ